MALIAGVSTPGLQQANPSPTASQMQRAEQNIQNNMTLAGVSAPKPPTWEQRIAPMVAAVKAQKAADALAAQKAAEAAAEAARQAALVAASSEVQTPQPAPIHAASSVGGILAAIRHCESGDNYTAQNRQSTASGAYQFLDSTWAGYGGYARAMYAPPGTQDAYAQQEYAADGTRPWAASESCWG